MNGFTILCPVCEMDYTHLDSAVIVNPNEALRMEAHGEDERAVIRVTTARDTAPYTGRRHTIVIEGSCEAGHVFHVCFEQHKGQTTVEVVVA